MVFEGFYVITRKNHTRGGLFGFAATDFDLEEAKLAATSIS